VNRLGFRLDDQKIDGRVSVLREELESLKDYGLSCVELPVHGLDVIKNCEIDGRALKAVAGTLGEFGYDYTVHCADSMDLMDEDNGPDHLKLFISSLDFCRHINAKVFVCHPGRFFAGEGPPAGKNAPDARMRRGLMEMEKGYIKNAALKYPEIKICMENARPYSGVTRYCYAEETDVLARQVSEIGCNNVGINLDTGHLNLSAGHYNFDQIRAVENMKDHIFHMHLHDNFGKTCRYSEKKQTHLVPLGRGDCHMPPGMGNAPVKEILDMLKKSYKGYFVFEYRSRYREFLRGSVNEFSSYFNNSGLE
jgi:sugar phosphate isomerase/epimerase